MTQNFKIIFAALLIALIAAPTAQAQDFGRSLERFSELNRINPLQNRSFERSGDVLTRKVIDGKNKVVGKVTDVTIRGNGTIQSIVVDFDRLLLSRDVSLNYRELRIDSRADTYALGLDADEIKEFYPQLLANIETASGEGTDVTSVRKIENAPLHAADGRRLGHVREILFGGNGGRVDALYVELSFGTKRGDTAAVPFRSTSVEYKNGRAHVILPNNLVDALFEVADR